MTTYLRHAVWQFILEQNVGYLPVNPFDIIEANGWLIYTYDHFRTLVHSSAFDMIYRRDPDGFSFWSRRDRAFVIAYNHYQDAPHIRWTLAHEIGHIVLGHHESGILSETEADGFACRLLAPSVVLHACHIHSPEDIAAYCGIPTERAQERAQRMAYLEAIGAFWSHPLENHIYEQFEPYIKGFLYNKISGLGRMEIAAEFFVAAS